MPSPFPGMDPYLERPDPWHVFHLLLAKAAAKAICKLLPQQYLLMVGNREYIRVPNDPEAVQLSELGVRFNDPGYIRGGPPRPPGTFWEPYLKIVDRHD